MCRERGLPHARTTGTCLLLPPHVFRNYSFYLCDRLNARRGIYLSHTCTYARHEHAATSVSRNRFTIDMRSNWSYAGAIVLVHLRVRINSGCVSVQITGGLNSEDPAALAKQTSLRIAPHTWATPQETSAFSKFLPPPFPAALQLATVQRKESRGRSLRFTQLLRRSTRYLRVSVVQRAQTCQSLVER